VFYSAKEFADDCQKFLKVFPGGKPLPNDDAKHAASVDELIGVTRCTAYIRGVHDGQLEATFGSHYHPVSSQIDFLGVLVTTSVKYVLDHPEEQDFAASTILGQAEKIIAKSEGLH
ncbi:MAG: hypothetical protein ACRDHW_22905, partial [Ktedonobacteraceae bacterium]